MQVDDNDDDDDEVEDADVTEGEDEDQDEEVDNKSTRMIFLSRWQWNRGTLVAEI